MLRKRKERTPSKSILETLMRDMQARLRVPGLLQRLPAGQNVKSLIVTSWVQGEALVATLATSPFAARAQATIGRPAWTGRKPHAEKHPEGDAQLLHKPRLLKLRKHAHDLTHSNPHLVITLGEVVPSRRDTCTPRPTIVAMPASCTIRVRADRRPGSEQFALSAGRRDGQAVEEGKSRHWETLELSQDRQEARRGRLSQ